MKAASPTPITTGWTVAVGPHLLAVTFSCALSCRCHVLHVQHVWCCRVDN